MAVLQDLLSKIEDVALRERIANEVDKITKQKKFGLVFEEHIPECTPLYDIPIKIGANIAMKTGYVNDIYTVIEINGANVLCRHKETHEQKTFSKDEVVVVAEFGEPIYPYLKPIDSICNAQDSDLWHTLIEADNYHALQLLEYLYAGKVDCIYIDPPYNTGAKDWKYNNDYVDSSDSYRHSKWLSMMEKRLKIAKKLLNPKDSVLIVTIDEKEYLHLGCLLEQMFPEARIQMISSIVSRNGAVRMNRFTRVNEFIYFVMLGESLIIPQDEARYAQKGETVHWQSFRRSNATNIRPSRPSQFYPIYVDRQSHKIVKIGNQITPEVDRFSVEQLDGCDAVFPIREDGTEMLWGVTPDECRERLAKGYIRAGTHTPNKPQMYVIQYLMRGTIEDIENGSIAINGYANDGSVIAENIKGRKMLPKTQWNFDSHDARDNGTKILKNVIGESRFDFPKSIYAVRDCLNYFIANKPYALVVDFFAGSGTTLHAVNLLNAEDGGHRRCIMVTNNEVSDEEAKNLKAQGYKPGDEEWEKLGVARYVTWPRTTCSIEGHNINGEPLKGNYLGSDLPMADGFKANAVYFKLGFLDKMSIALGRQFKELMPILWMKAGAIGACPTLSERVAPSMLILSENSFAVLTDESEYLKFKMDMGKHPEIKTIYFVTDSESAYKAMTRDFTGVTTYQLYKDYLTNFRINYRR